MFNIIQIHHVQATFVAVVFGFLLIEFIKYNNAKRSLMENRRKYVGRIDPNEVNQELIKEENDIIMRQRELSNTKATNFNHSNNRFKARVYYTNKLQQIQDDRESLLY